MRVLQLIDSLEPGGAERIAVTFANALTNHTEKSYLCTTRKEGVLKDFLQKNVSYIFLNKRKTLDFSALFKLRKLVKEEKINIIHAHSTSYFFATLLKFFTPRVQIIWHEHHGNRIQKRIKNNKTLWFCSSFFFSIITVNESLRAWCKKNLNTKNVYYLPNFIDLSTFSESNLESKTIICVANLRKPKNHLNLITAFKEVIDKFPEWRLKLIGKDFEDDYSSELKNYIKENNLDNSIQFMGLRNDIANQLKDASIGVLSSDSEGLPMALLEYGAAGLAVVCTDVGHCKNVIANTGIVVPPKDSNALSEALLQLIEDISFRKSQGVNFRKRVEQHYSLKYCLKNLIDIYKNDTK